MTLGKWLLASLGLCALVIGMGLIGYFILGAGSVIGLLLGAVLSVISVSALHRLAPRETPPAASERDIATPAPRSRREQEHLDAFGAMSLNDVRARAEEFEAARAQYLEWLNDRRARRVHALDPHEQEGYAPEVQNGDRAKRWRALEQELRQRSLCEVDELPEPERLQWARQLVALSGVLSRPERRWIGPKPPQPEIRHLPDERRG